MLTTTHWPKKITEPFRTHKWEVTALAVILLVGVFLRAYHFTDWLHFEIDQAYDFSTVSPALTDGIGHLSLLGPNVGGGLLRLGPAFYYLEYCSALIFGNTPAGHAGAVLILSLLSLPLFYVFVRRYFSVMESLGLLAIFSTSLFSVLYSRFSWSPNVLPFLMLLSSYALLRAVSATEKHPARWFLLAVATVAVTSQIHLNSFFTAPLIAIAFVAIKRPKYHWKIWLAAFAIVTIVYSPVIVNHFRDGGANLHLLKVKLEKTGPRIAPPLQTASETVVYDAYEYFFIVTGNDQINGMKLTGYGFSCGDCEEQLPVKIFAILLFAAAGLLFLGSFLRERDADRKNFLLLAGLWMLVSFALFYTVAQGYRMYPRFFLIVSPLAVLWYGFLLRGLAPDRTRTRSVIYAAIILVLVSSNIGRIIPVFDQLRDVQTATDATAPTGDIFPDTDRITLGELGTVAGYVATRSRESGYPTYLSAKSEFVLPLWTILNPLGIRYHADITDKTLFTEGNYFDIKFSGARPNDDPKFTVTETRNFGMHTVYTLHPNPEYIVAERQLPDDHHDLMEMKVLMKLLTWSR